MEKNNTINSNGKVYIVGAGIGDPKLITVRGVECLRLADVVIYDRLINLSLLNEAPQAEWIDVGKVPHHHHYPQSNINALLIEKAKQGKTVVRLKGGDPFMFGRGGEEALALVQENIPFEVVPGVTSAIAAPAYSGIPVTHRGVSSGVAIFTGHKSDPQPSLFSCIFPLVKDASSQKDVFPAINTLVFLMGIENLPRIVEQLLSNQISPDTPAALIERGSYSNQKTVISTLSRIVQEAADIQPPAVFIVGDVVRLRNEIQWFESLQPSPLSPLRIVNTRPRDSSTTPTENLTSKLIKLGAEVIEIPAIEINPSPQELLAQGVSRFNQLMNQNLCSWLLFTSGHAVQIFLEQWFSMGKDARMLSSVKIGVIGKSCAESLHRFGLLPDFIPSHAYGKTLAAELPIQPNEYVFIPTAKNSMPHLREELQQRGVIVEEMITHESIPCNLNESRINLFLKKMVDVILFFSPTAFHSILTNLSSYAHNHPHEVYNSVELLNSFAIGCIGDTTAAAIQQAGIKVDFVSKNATTDDFIESLIEWNNKREKNNSK